MKNAIVLAITVLLLGACVEASQTSAKTDMQVSLKNDMHESRQATPETDAGKTGTRYLICNFIPHTEKVVLTRKERPQVYFPYLIKRNGGRMDEIAFCIQDSKGVEHETSVPFQNVVAILINYDSDAVMSEIIPEFQGQAQGEHNWITSETKNGGPNDVKSPKGIILILTPQDYDGLFSNS